MTDSPIDQARAAGYSDDEINAYLKPKIVQAQAAGYSDDEINSYLGVKPQPQSDSAPNFFVRHGLATETSPLGKFDGTLAGAARFITDVPQDIYDYFTKSPSALEQARAVNEAIKKKDAEWEEQTGKKLGPLQHAPGFMDLMLSNPLMTAMAPGEGLTRTGESVARDVTTGKPLPETPVTVGKVPTPQDFSDAATALRGTPDAAAEAKLKQIWDQRGVHPSEVAMAAQHDPVLTQELAADNVDIPRAFGEEAPPPEKPSEPSAPAETPAEGSPEEAQQKVLDKISVGEKNAKPRVTFDQVYQNVVDDLYPLHEAVKEATEGEGLPTAQNPYELARLTRGDAGRADYMLQYGTFEWNTYKTNGPGLKQILAPVGKDMDGFRAYAVASRALELQARGIESGIDQSAAATVVGAGKAKYDATFRSLVEYQNKVAAYSRDAGVLSDGAYAAMTEANKSFVPFYRIMDDGTASGASAGGRSVQSSNLFKRIKGSQRDIVDPIESVVRNTYALIAMAERNAVGKALIDLPNSERFAEKINPPVKGITVSDDEMAKFLQENGVGKVPDDLLTVFRASRVPLGEGEIRVYDNGKPTTYKVDPAMATAFKGLDASGTHWMAKLLEPFARTLRAGSVLTPEFAARHIFRDYIYAGITSENLFTPWDMAKGVWGLITKDGDYQNWLKSGGANNSSVSLDRRYLQENIRKLTSDTGLMTRSLNVIRHPLDGLRVLTELAENASHLGAFKKNFTGTAKEDILAAGFKSRDTAVDSARMGAQMRAYNAISAFANITVQDTDRMVRAFKDNPIGTTLKVAAGVVLPSMLLWFANRDDPRYKEIPEWEKDLFWHVMTKDHIFRIPKPFGVGIVFGSGTERMLDALVARDPEAFKNFSRSVADTVIPGVVPTAVAPLIDQFANRSTFTGNSLIPDRLEKLMPEYQYNPYTTETAKALGRLISAFPGVKRESLDQQNMMLGGVARALTSPALIENYVRAWSGNLGVYALGLADKGLRLAGVVPDPPMPSPTLSDIPVVKAFVTRYPSASMQSIQDFYDKFTEKKIVFDTVMAKAKEGDARAVNESMEFDPGAMVQLDGFKQAISEHAQLIRMIYQNPQMSPSDKRQLIDTLYFRMSEIAKAGNEAMKSVDKSVAK